MVIHYSGRGLIIPDKRKYLTHLYQDRFRKISNFFAPDSKLGSNWCRGNLRKLIEGNLIVNFSKILSHHKLLKRGAYKINFESLIGSFMIINHNLVWYDLGLVHFRIICIIQGH